MGVPGVANGIATGGAIEDRSRNDVPMVLPESESDQQTFSVPRSHVPRPSSRVSSTRIGTSRNVKRSAVGRTSSRDSSFNTDVDQLQAANERLRERVQTLTSDLSEANRRLEMAQQHVKHVCWPCAYF